MERIKRYMKCLYISDLDGTLLDKNEKISDQSVKILNRLIGRGLLFSVNTARSPVSTLPILQNLHLTLPVVLMNGVMIYDPLKDTMLKLYPVEIAAAYKVIEVFESAGRAPYVYSYDGGLHLRYKKIHQPQTELFFNQRKKDYKSLEQCDEYFFKYPIVYINLMDTLEALKPIYEKITAMPEVRCAFYPDNYLKGMWFLEVFSGEADKGRGAKQLQNILGAQKLIAFGDNYNDATLLEAADIGIAVANAPEEIRMAADFVIGPHDRDSVAKAVEALGAVYGF